MAASTFRSWVIGSLFVVVGGFINQFFSIRYPGITVGANVVQLLSVSSPLTPTELAINTQSYVAPSRLVNS